MVGLLLKRYAGSYEDNKRDCRLKGLGSMYPIIPYL